MALILSVEFAFGSCSQEQRKNSLGKRPGRPQKTRKVDDLGILSMDKRNLFTPPSSQVKNTLHDVNISLSRSTIKRCLHEYKYEGFILRCTPLVPLKIRKTRADLKKKNKKAWYKIF